MLSYRSCTGGEAGEGLLLIVLFMKIRINRARPSALVLALAAVFSTSTFSQTENRPSLKETVVSATRSEQPLVDIVADVSIIERATLDR